MRTRSSALPVAVPAAWYAAARMLFLITVLSKEFTKLKRTNALVEKDTSEMWESVADTVR